MHIATAQDQAEDMAELIRDIEPDRLAWLVLRCPDFAQLANWSPGAVLLAEMMRRIYPDCEGATLTSKGWIKEDGEVVEYH